MSGCENCNISVNNGKYCIGFQPCGYKYFPKKALLDANFGLRFLGLYLKNASFLEFLFRLRVHFK